VFGAPALCSSLIRKSWNRQHYDGRLARPSFYRDLAWILALCRSEYTKIILVDWFLFIGQAVFYMGMTSLTVFFGLFREVLWIVRVGATTLPLAGMIASRVLSNPCPESRLAFAYFPLSSASIRDLDQAAALGTALLIFAWLALTYAVRRCYRRVD